MSSALRVLLIEDSEDDTDLLMLALARGKLKTEIHIVDTRPGMLDALQTQTWDIVLADYHLPQFSGPEALQVLQEQGLDIPFIIISGAMGEDVAVAMMKAGAHDYVLKSNLARLIPAIERELREANSRRAREIAERSLQATQRKYADLIHSIDGIVWEANAESLVITFVSEKLSRMLGYDRDSWQEHPSAWLDQIHPDDAERVVKAHRDALQHQPSYTLEYRRQHANGTYIWMRDTVSVAPDGGGRISLRGILMDITEAKHSADERERLLALAEERAEEILYLARQLQQIMDTTDQGIILLDPQCRLLLMNRAAQNILPLLISEDLSLDNPQERPIITQLSAQPMSELLARAIANNLPTEINLGAPHNRIFEITLHPVAAGITERGWLLSIVDVTQQRHLQAQVEQRNHLMAVGQLASGIAHDFNNILGVITLHLGLVQRSSALTDKDRERLNLIERQTDHAAHLIHQILDFSRRSVMELQEVELVEFFHEFMGILESTITSDVRIELAHGMKRHSVQADRTRLQQLFLNLIVNARDAMQ
jgi:PAS domain S-box-containing protein